MNDLQANYIASILGGRLLAFSADKQLNDEHDRLIMVDSRNSEPRVLARYMGENGAAHFLACHGSNADAIRQISWTQRFLDAASWAREAQDARRRITDAKRNYGRPEAPVVSFLLQAYIWPAFFLAAVMHCFFWSPLNGSHFLIWARYSFSFAVTSPPV